MQTLETPGVYWETEARINAGAAVRMDVTGFVGIAEKGPLDRPVRVRNIREFAAHFGGPIAGGFLAYSVRGYFENGGKAAWVVRVASQDAATGAQPASRIFEASASGLPPFVPGWRISASSPGSWGNRLSVAVQPGTRTVTRSIPRDTNPTELQVESLAGLEAHDLVRISQGALAILRPIAWTAVATRSIGFIPQDGAAMPWHLPLAGLDLARPVIIERLSATLLVRLDAQVTGIARELSYVPGSRRYGPTLLAQPVYPERPEHHAGTHDPEVSGAPFPICVEAVTEPVGQILPLAATAGAFFPLDGGQDGLCSLRVGDFTGSEPPVAEFSGRRGLAGFEFVDEPAQIAIPDACILPAPEIMSEPIPRLAADPCDPCGPQHDPARLRVIAPGEQPPRFSDDDIFAIQQAMVEHCEARRDRMALIDPPFPAVSTPLLGLAALEDWRNRFDTSFAAIYAPWVSVVDPRDTGRNRFLPPSGHVAGQYARADDLEGVHHAAANRDVDWAESASLAINDAAHGLLNTQAVNAIRAVNGRPLRILGSRLAAAEAAVRDVPVRRVIMMMRRCIARLLTGFVFEPHNEELRQRLVLTLETFLTGLWERGAIAGTAAEDAFAVVCDETNNPASERGNGRLFCDVAFAAVRPMEFIVLRIGVAGNEIETAEMPFITRGDAA